MESINKAADFIIESMVNPTTEKMANRLYVYAANVNRNFNKEQLKYFKEVLETGMKDEIYEYGTSELKTDYLPLGLLHDSLLVTDMPLNACPLNMDVVVSREDVKVRIGMNKPFEEIYQEKEKVKKKKLV
jgi:hypothetical protein